MIEFDQLPVYVRSLCIAPTAPDECFIGIAEAWEWLIPDIRQHHLLLVTAFGDLFLRNGSEIFFLNADAGSIDFVARDETHWLGMLNDTDAVELWFAKTLLEQVRDRLGALPPDEVYYTIHPPFLGGGYEVENFDIRRWDAHLWTAGQLHQQTKDLPEGTRVTLKFDQW